MGETKIVIRDITKEEAKKEIVNLIDNADADTLFYPDEVANKLHIDFQLTMEIIEELINAGVVEVC